MNWAWWDGKMPVDHYRHEHELDHEIGAESDAGFASDAADSGAASALEK
jgi:hypothetical protein